MAKVVFTRYELVSKAVWDMPTDETTVLIKEDQGKIIILTIKTG